MPAFCFTPLADQQGRFVAKSSPLGRIPPIALVGIHAAQGRS